MKLFLNFFLLNFILACFFPIQAFAYVDPGSGSLLLQMLIAGAIGALFYLRIFWGKIKNFIFRRRTQEKSNEK